MPHSRDAARGLPEGTDHECLWFHRTWLGTSRTAGGCRGNPNTGLTRCRSTGLREEATGTRSLLRRSEPIFPATGSRLPSSGKAGVGGAAGGDVGVMGRGAVGGSGGLWAYSGEDEGSGLGTGPTTARPPCCSHFENRVLGRNRPCSEA